MQEEAMPDDPSARSPSAFRQTTLSREADEVIAALRALARRVSSSAIHDCLEAARFDIAYAAAAPLPCSITPADDEESEEEDCF
jgi:hypothetical protein